MALLATNVHVKDERGTHHVFGPDDEVPAWAATLITNPAAWEGGELPSASRLAEPAPAPARAPAKRATSRRKAAANAPVHDG